MGFTPYANRLLCGISKDKCIDGNRGEAPGLIIQNPSVTFNGNNAGSSPRHEATSTSSVPCHLTRQATVELTVLSHLGSTLDISMNNSPSSQDSNVLTLVPFSSVGTCRSALKGSKG